MLYHFCRFLYKSPPLFRTFRTYLPISIIFISDAPIFYIVWLFLSISNSPFCIFTFIFKITIFYPVTHFFCCSGSCIGADIRFTGYFSAHMNIFICPKRVRILYTPCFIKKWLPILSHPIFPMVRRYKTSSRPTQNRDFDFLHRFNDVLAKSFLI